MDRELRCMQAVDYQSGLKRNEPPSREDGEETWRSFKRLLPSEGSHPKRLQDSDCMTPRHRQNYRGKERMSGCQG